MFSTSRAPVSRITNVAFTSTISRAYSQHPVSNPNSKQVYYKNAFVTRERLDKYNLGVTSSLVPKTSRPPKALLAKLKKKWRLKALANMRHPNDTRTKLRTREDNRTVHALREGQFDAIDALLRYNMLKRPVNIDVYNKLLEQLALISHKHDVLGESVQLYDDMCLAKNVEPDQFTYYYLIYIAAQANHLPRAMFFYREYAIRYFVNLEPRNLHASILTMLWRLIWKEQDADRALALFRSSIQHGFYSTYKEDFFVFEDQQNLARPSFVEQAHVDPLLTPSVAFLKGVLGGVQLRLPAAKGTVGTARSNSIFDEVLTVEDGFSTSDVTDERIEQFIQKMREAVDPAFFGDLYELPGSESMDIIEQFEDASFDPSKDALDIFKHAFGLPSEFRVGAPLTLHQHQQKRRQQLEAEIERATQVDILGKLKRSADSNWLATEFKFNDVIEEAYNDFRRLWIVKSQKDARDILLEHGNLHFLSNIDLFAAKVLERRRHRLTAALFSSENFAEDIAKYQQMYRDFRRKAGQLIQLHYKGMRWVPVILGRSGEVFIPKSINIFEITDDKIMEAKKEFVDTLFKKDKTRRAYLRKYSHRLRIRWFDVEKREFVKDFFYK